MYATHVFQLFTPEMFRYYFFILKNRAIEGQRIFPVVVDCVTELTNLDENYSQITK